jgi:integrase
MPRERAQSKALRLEQANNGVWYANGSFNGERIRRSLRTRDERRAAEALAQFEAKLWKRLHYGEEQVRTFEEAAVSYMKAGGERRFLAPIIKHFKGRNVGSIKPAEIRAMAMMIYPIGAPATRNRQAIMPARAVMVHAHDLGWCPLMRVRQFDVPKSRKHKSVGRDWLDAFMAEADKSGLPHLSAIVLFMHQTGARVSEAVHLTGKWVDLDHSTAVLEKTKTDEMSARALTPEMMDRMRGLDLADDKPVFWYTDPKAVNRALKRVAERAGLEPLSTHSVGRHSFATNAINGGAKIKDAMDAGGWKSAKLFMETYVHSREAAESVAAIFASQGGQTGKVRAKSPKPRRSRFGKQT